MLRGDIGDVGSSDVSCALGPWHLCSRVLTLASSFGTNEQGRIGVSSLWKWKFPCILRAAKKTSLIDLNSSHLPQFSGPVPREELPPRPPLALLSTSLCTPPMFSLPPSQSTLSFHYRRHSTLATTSPPAHVLKQLVFTPEGFLKSFDKYLRGVRHTVFRPGPNE